MSNLFSPSDKTTRRRAYVLLAAGTFSFLVGLIYGTVRRYQDPLQNFLGGTTVEIQLEDKSNISSEIELERKQPNVNIKIKAVGDIVPGTNYPQNRLAPQKKVYLNSLNHFSKELISYLVTLRVH